MINGALLGYLLEHSFTADDHRESFFCDKMRIITVVCFLSSPSMGIMGFSYFSAFSFFAHFPRLG